MAKTKEKPKKAKRSAVPSKSAVVSVEPKPEPQKPSAPALADLVVAKLAEEEDKQANLAEQMWIVNVTPRRAIALLAGKLHVSRQVAAELLDAARDRCISQHSKDKPTNVVRQVARIIKAIQLAFESGKLHLLPALEEQLAKLQGNYEPERISLDIQHKIMLDRTHAEMGEAELGELNEEWEEMQRLAAIGRAVSATGQPVVMPALPKKP